MSLITFHGENGLAQITMQDGVEMKIVGGAVSAGGPVLAYRQDGGWYLGTQRFERITCEGPVRIEFVAQNALRSFGPFSELTISADVVSSDKTILARYRPMDEVWHFDRHLEAEVLVVRDAEVATA